MCLLLFVSLNGISQSLTIDETISYLNKLSLQHPAYPESHAEWFSYLSHDSCKNGNVYIIQYTRGRYLSIQQIEKRYFCPDLLRNRTKDGPYLGFDVTKFYSIALRDVHDKYSDQDLNPGIDISTKERGIYLSMMDRAYLKVYYNGLKYLIAAISQKISREEAAESALVDDPFLKKPHNANIVKRQSKVLLIPENGIFKLNVTLGNGFLSKFVLDSGAGECSISSDLEKKLISENVIKKSDYLENGLYKLADGSIVENRRVRIEKIKIGTKTISNVVVSVGPPGSPNLLGQSFLNKLNNWSIDNSKNLLIIE
ncbi:MAG: retroviral-like aspartic protease family protein [Methylotenera sp.]|nr:retroviral-like aspartic protease family protein [Flavobacterium sp.]